MFTDPKVGEMWRNRIKIPHSGSPTVHPNDMKIRKWIDKTKKAQGKKHVALRIILDSGKTIARFFSSTAERNLWEQTKLQELLAKHHVKVDDSGEEAPAYKLSWAIDQYIDYGEREPPEGLGWRPKTVLSRRDRLNKLLNFLGDVWLKDITRTDIIYFIQTGRRNETRKGLSSDVVAFLNWCGNEDQGRRYVQPRMFLELKWKKVVEDEPEIGFLTVEEARDLMNSMTDKYKAPMALALFAGLRSWEISRIEWKDINFRRNQIKIRPAVSKTRKNRTLANLPDNLWAWLRKYKGEGQIIKNYNAFNLSRRRACARIELDYPHNAARHCFGTFGYWRGEEWARRTMGHTGNTKIFHKHYVEGGAIQEESEEYFAIYPPKKKNKTPPVD